MTQETITPNAPVEQSAATVENAAPLSDDSLFAKMTAMRESTERNQLRALSDVETGSTDEAKSARPVAPEEPEDSTTPAESAEAYTDVDTQSEETVSDDAVSDTAPDDMIDFLEFTETNPNAKFKFTRDGKEVVIDAKKAAAILGQGGAIHEDARKLKIERSEFDEYRKEQTDYHNGLTLAMEFTVAPRMQKAYDEIVKTQGFNQVFNEQLARTQDPTEIAQIQANIQQNNRYMRQQGDFIQRVKPNIEQFKQIRQQQVTGLLDKSRKNFSDKELKNEYVFNELRDKLGRQWKSAQDEAVPGIKNLDLITSDETILGLIRDGMKFRDRPVTKQAGNSIASLTGRRTGASTQTRSTDDGIQNLREKAKAGDKKAGNDLLSARLAQIRGKNR